MSYGRAGRGGGDEEQAPQRVPGADRRAERGDDGEAKAERVDRAGSQAQPYGEDGRAGDRESEGVPGRDGERGEIAAEVFQQGAGGAAEEAGEGPVVGRDGCVEGADPAVARTRDCGGGDRGGGGRDDGRRDRLGRAVTRADLQDHDRGEPERGRCLDQGGERDEYGAQDRPAAERGDQADAEEAEHDRVVVGACDEVEQDQRVEGAEPERGGRVGAAVPGEPGQRGGHQAHSEEGDDPHPEEPGGEFAAGQPGQPRGEGEEHRAVRRAGVLPQRGDLVGERPAERGGAVRVDVHVGVDHGALREVAVHVPAEQRRREQQRGRPYGEDQEQGARGGRFGAADQLAQQQPGRDQQDDTEVDPDQPERRLRGGRGEEVR